MIAQWEASKGPEINDVPVETRKKLEIPPTNIIYLVKRNPLIPEGNEFWVCSDQTDVEKVQIDYADIRVDEKFVGHS